MVEIDGEVVRARIGALFVVDRDAFETIAIVEFGHQLRCICDGRRGLAGGDQPVVSGNADDHVLHAQAKAGRAVLLALAGDDRGRAVKRIDILRRRLRGDGGERHEQCNQADRAH